MDGVLFSHSVSIAHRRRSWIAEQRTGRMLRAPTFFEDVLKMILTINCSWSLTETMNERLIEHFGAVAWDGSRCFPTAAAIADSNEAQLRQEVRLGNRAPYVLEYARRVASGALDIENGTPVPDTEIEAYYARFEEWKGLVM